MKKTAINATNKEVEELRKQNDDLRQQLRDCQEELDEVRKKNVELRSIIDNNETYESSSSDEDPISQEEYDTSNYVLAPNTPERKEVEDTTVVSQTSDEDMVTQEDDDDVSTELDTDSDPELGPPPNYRREDDSGDESQEFVYQYKPFWDFKGDSSL